MEQTESEGKTVAEAVENALSKMGLRRDQVEVQIIQEASAGFLGMGAKPARVRLSEKLWGEPAQPCGAPAALQPSTRRPIGRASRPEPAPLRAAVDSAKACGETAAVLNDLLGKMGFALQSESPGIAFKSASLLAAWRRRRAACRREGSTLEAAIFCDADGQPPRRPVAVQVDAMGYWDKREKAILPKRRKVLEVRSTGRPFRLPPMDAPRDV